MLQKQNREKKFISTAILQRMAFLCLKSCPFPLPLSTAFLLQILIRTKQKNASGDIRLYKKISLSGG